MTIQKWPHTLLSICLLTSVTASGAIAGVCNFETISFAADFDGGRISGCRETQPHRFEIGVAPEDAPVNPSSWYAFAVEASTAEDIEVTLVYAHGRHRYEPKMRQPGGAWRALGAAQVSKDGARATFSFSAPAGETIIAAQPVIADSDYRAWIEKINPAAAGLREFEIGKSEEGRTITALQTTARRSQTVVLIGRQHPPETTGAIAFFAFAGRLMANDPLAQAFRRRFAILAIPMLNPDGVALGQWRNNARGLDINRDWGPFTQAETRAARDAIAAAAGAKPGRLALFLDFHSTWRDTLYTQPDDAVGERAWFPGAWIDAIETATGGAPKRDAAHNPWLPTAKSWAHETYAAPAITVELGDKTPVDKIEADAVVAAETAMRLLLNGAPAAEDLKQ